jgi:hypothetical protein
MNELEAAMKALTTRVTALETASGVPTVSDFRR